MQIKNRRSVQEAYNKAHGITPKTVHKAIEDIIEREDIEKKESAKDEIKIRKGAYNLLLERDRKKYIKELEKQMLEYAKLLEFEKAAELRDEIQRIREGKDS